MMEKPPFNILLPVSLAFNQPCNRFDIDIRVRSDVSSFRVSLYERQGVYWFCLEHAFDINSCGFVGLRNCVRAMRETVRVLGFRLLSLDDLDDFVDSFERACKYRKVGA